MEGFYAWVGITVSTFHKWSYRVYIHGSPDVEVTLTGYKVYGRINWRVICVEYVIVETEG